MLIKIGFDIEFELAGPTPMILMLYVHPSRQNDLRSEEKILVEPEVPLTDFTDLYGNRCARILAPAGNLRLSLNALIEDRTAASSTSRRRMRPSTRLRTCRVRPFPFF
jgi:hypothetical protein